MKKIPVCFPVNLPASPHAVLDAAIVMWFMKVGNMSIRTNASSPKPLIYRYLFTVQIEENMHANKNKQQEK